MSSERWISILKTLQFSGFVLLVAALPLSNFIMSLATFWLAGVWLLEVITDIKTTNKLRNRWSRFISNKPAILLFSLFLLPLTGLLWTDDFGYAGWDLRMKLPILLLPFLLTTLNPITDREYRSLLGIFLLTLTIAITFCLLIYWHIYPKPYQDVREISVFISHVRFSLLIILGICIVFVEAWNKPMGKALAVILTILFIYFLYVIGSMTGIIVLSSILLWTLIRLFSGTKIRWAKILLGCALLIFPIIGFFILNNAYVNYFRVPEVAWDQLEKTSPHGEVYDHNPQYLAIEDGHYVMTHIAWGELYQGWLEKSTINPDSADARGHILKGTLIRYLASKGLKKDLEGLRALSDEDVKAIESGMPRFNENVKSGLRKRIDNIFFELANYRAGGSPNGHSVFQRFEFWKTAMFIIRAHPLTGVGTGDVKKTFAETYERTNSPLDAEHRLRAHNQYLTIWLTYGIFGLIYFIAVLFIPLIKGHKNLLIVAFTIISSLSFLTEDTLESQAGVMFFTFFYVFFNLKRKITLSTLRPVK